MQHKTEVPASFTIGENVFVPPQAPDAVAPPPAPGRSLRSLLPRKTPEFAPPVSQRQMDIGRFVLQEEETLEGAEFWADAKALLQQVKMPEPTREEAARMKALVDPSLTDRAKQTIGHHAGQHAMYGNRPITRRAAAAVANKLRS